MILTIKIHLALESRVTYPGLYLMYPDPTLKKKTPKLDLTIMKTRFRSDTQEEPDPDLTYFHNWTTVLNFSIFKSFQYIWNMILHYKFCLIVIGNKETFDSDPAIRKTFDPDPQPYWKELEKYSTVCPPWCSFAVCEGVQYSSALPPSMSKHGHRSISPT